MRRHYVSTSLLSVLFRVFFALSLLVLFLAGLEWLLTVALPKAAPFLVAVALFAAGRLWSSLRG